MAKPKGWWTTHPTILTVTVAGCWDSNGDGIGDFEGIRRHLDENVGALRAITGAVRERPTRGPDPGLGPRPVRLQVVPGDRVIEVIP